MSGFFAKKEIKLIDTQHFTTASVCLKSAIISKVANVVFIRINKPSASVDSIVGGAVI